MRFHSKYRHIATLDTDLYVHHVQYEHKDYFKVWASLIDRKSEYVYETASFKIQKEHLKYWRIVV